MIVRNEEKFLGGCLESIRGIVDEIVVVDTGSEDRTREIALEYGARVFDFPWNGDFAAARNEALNRSRGEWILYIDADERLRPADKSYVRKILSDPGKVAYTLLFYPIVGYTAYPEHRIFRNDSRIRFEGVIHESMLGCIRSVALEDGLEIGHSELMIDHLGYEGDLSHKHERNVPLLREQIENDPQRIYLRWQLGAALMAMGDAEGAEKALRDAIEIVRDKKKKEPGDSTPYYDLIRLLNDQGRDFSDLLDECAALFPDDHLITWTKAMKLMHDQEFQDAARLFESLAGTDPKNVDGEFLAFNAGIFGELSYEPLATCYFKLGRLEESLKFYSLALECDPENQEYMTKHKFITALLNKPG